MTNRFGFDLPPDRLRWAAAEGVSEDVIAAVLLLHHSSVDEIAPQLSAPELEQVINLVDRNPRLYPPGIVQALKQRRDLTAPRRRRKVSGRTPRRSYLTTQQSRPVGMISATSPTLIKCAKRMSVRAPLRGSSAVINLTARKLT